MASRFVSWLKSPRNTGALYSFFLPAAFLLCLALLLSTIFVGKDSTERSVKSGIDFIRGSRYPKTSEVHPQPPKVRPNLSPQPQPPPPVQPPEQQPPPSPQSQPPPSPQQPLPAPQSQQPPPPEQPPPPSPQPQPPPPPPPEQQPPSPELQPETETETQVPPSQSPPPEPQPQPQRRTQPAPSPPPPPHHKWPPGKAALPKGLVANTSDLQMQPLWGRRKKVNSSTSLFTAAVGIKQKETVDKMVTKFLSSNFSVMLFHYDGVVDAWNDLHWSDNVIHVSAINQTKWWFAKRFLHPDIVTKYNYIFLWDEDLGIDNFDPGRYVSIVKDEGLEISQPALDTKKSEVHHAITSRWKNSTLHRRVKTGGNKNGCDWTSQYPPCTGWIELMAPVFSRAAWRCMWYMIQNDLNHAWGLDLMFGYCAQGDRTKNVGVVDAEYIVHFGFPTIGESQSKLLENPCNSSVTNARIEVRKHSHNEYKVFKRRWQAAVKEDKEWVDPYPESWNYSI
ncbi:uncharacterized protein LOC111886657 isoform X1 [Lactuca sativa]|uniref:uncharacterized protein LOC111886657 isoform X1 n=1 Tax=Lactuca sativa TaxID=4236 RepID=UPI000CD8540E|nr:uncharacterized protein LOC111886657 isoform X1 [Lactuca sativa]